MVGFGVPDDLREWCSSESVGVCSVCLELHEWTGEKANNDFSRILEGFPTERAGVAMAVSVGLLVDSVALHNDEIAKLFNVVESDGVDPWLVLERLCVSPNIEPRVDLDRARQQLEQLMG